MAGPKPNIEHPLRSHMPPRAFFAGDRVGVAAECLREGGARLAPAWRAWPVVRIGRDLAANRSADRLEAVQ